MSVKSGLWLAKSILICDGLAALYLADLIGLLGVALVLVAVAASWWQERHQERSGIGRRRESRVVALGVGGAAVGLGYLADSPLNAMLRVLLLILAYRLLSPRGPRAGRDVAFPCFAMLVAASTVSFGPALVLVVVAFLVAGTWMLMLQHAAVEMMEGGRGPAAGPAGLGPGLVRLGAIASVGTLVVTTGLFFIIPRIGHAALFRAAAGRMKIGFSDRVELGSIGKLETDATPVMRVTLPDGLAAASGAVLRWRGVVLDHFDGHVWTAAARRRVSVQATAGAVVIATPRGTGTVLRQEISLEPIGSDIIFAAPHVVRGRFRSDSVQVDEEAGTLAVLSAAARLRYEVESELDAPPSRAGRRLPVTPLTAGAAARYLQLPPLPARIHELAREVTAGSHGPLDAAHKLTVFLSSSRFRYTLLLERQTDLPPVDEFLFVRRSGNCEYFAAALAVMLRSVGIPARVVNGFQQGEWNPYGGYFIVRLLDAHAWVEAHVGDAGWVTLDSSPRGDTDNRPALSSLGLYLDAMRSRWAPYVVGWSLHDQLGAVVQLHEAVRHERSWRLPTDWMPAIPRPVVLAVLATGLLVAAIAWHRATGKIGPEVPLFYQRAVRALARHGLRPERGETAREFGQRVAGDWPSTGAPLSRLTTAYERVRFGAGALSRSEATELEGCVTELALTLRRRARPG